MLLCILSAALLMTASCGQDIPKPSEAPEYHESAIVYVDLNRWHSINTKDQTEVKRLWDALHVMATVQGIVNREEPIIYIEYVKANGVNTDEYWFDLFRKPGEWLDGREIINVYDPVKVAEMFKDRIKGLVVYDSEVASTSCIASTVAGIEDLIAVRYDTTPGSMYMRLRTHGFEPKVWLVGEDGTSIFHDKLEPYQWAIDNCLKPGKCDTRYAAYYIDQYWREKNTKSTINHHQLSNHDYFVSHKAFFFDLSPYGDEPATDAPDMPVGADLEMLKSILLETYNQNQGKAFCHIGGFAPWAFKYSNHSDVGGKHSPVNLEWEFSKVVSNYNAYVDADALSFGAVANSSFWQHFPLKDKYPQKWTTREGLKNKGYLTANGKVNRNKKYVLLYVGDYDAAAGVYQFLPSLWDDPNRGKVPMMWGISPVLEYRVPMILHHIRETATPLDYFACADNGAGYLNPGELEAPRSISGLPDGLDAWKDHCTPLYDRWDISITGFIIDGYGKGMSERGFKCYSAFSPNGIVPQKAPYLSCLVNKMPVMRSEGGTSDDPAQAARDIIDYVNRSHTHFPFYWFRNVFKSPSWYLSVKTYLEELSDDIVWMEAPDYFELVRCYNEEAGGIVY